MLANSPRGISCARLVGVGASLLLAVSSLSGCQTAGQITAQKGVSFTELSPSYAEQRPIGEAPFVVEKRSRVLRLAARDDAGNVGYLIVLDTEALDGDLPFAMPGIDRIGEVAFAYGEYLDRVLRVQRLIRRGEFQEAKRVLARLNEEYEVTPATAILNGIVAVFENNMAVAREHFRIAKLLHPSDPQLKEWNP